MSKRKPESNNETEGRLTKGLRKMGPSTLRTLGTPASSDACPTPQAPSALSPGGLSIACSIGTVRRFSPAPPPSDLSEVTTPRPSAEEHSSDSQRPLGTYNAFINGTDPSPNLPYNGLKAILAVIDKVGYALPPAVIDGVYHS